MATGTRKEPTQAWLDELAEQRLGLQALLRFVLAYKKGELDVSDFELGLPHQR